ncbi:hypothetical protein RHGRI_007060 [Rhododendron griersonianum]|uniref:Uncharacterized protein n=1 Tax=Rhododendron griersonianum TaxID=479676 RepID=A0AAV6KVG0_9ERIC|nr:hypothetical protein RHGRI_007060 [Rhododendron griersonianum]
MWWLLGIEGAVRKAGCWGLLKMMLLFLLLLELLKEETMLVLQSLFTLLLLFVALAAVVPRPNRVLGGIARHCNYLGDLLLAASFSLPCGIISPIPYFYPIYLLILLIWRERRDEARCAEKYREVWAEYCKLVPWRILPYAY